MRKTILTKDAPAPIGPYAQGVAVSGSLLFVSGQIPKDPKTGEMPPDVRGQAAQCLRNIKAIVEAAGATMADVVRVGAYLKDLADFKDFNEVYQTFFSEPYPARSTIQATPPGGCRVEMDAVVLLGK
jgi:2-iminobutanoate/2-iminopropanoate deaminase